MKQMESEKQTKKNEKQTKGDKRMEDEKQAARKRRDKRYNDYVKQVTPKHNFLFKYAEKHLLVEASFAPSGRCFQIGTAVWRTYEG